jgi:hypothetical protein
LSNTSNQEVDLYNSNDTAIKTPLNSTVAFNNHHHYYTLTKSIIQHIPQNKYFNVGEPSFASNGTFIFYTGNHYAAKSNNSQNWNYVDPSFDFKGYSPNNSTSGHSNQTHSSPVDLFKSDQRVIYDPIHHIYIWIRLSATYDNGQITNIERLAISKNTTRWVAYDFIPIHIFNEANITDAQFDYPEAVISKDYLYISGSLVVGDNCQNEYGTIIRIPLNDLSNSLDYPPPHTISYYTVLDRNVTAISPIDGISNATAYFGAHLKNSSQMKIYEWKENSNSLTNKTISIAPWTDIHNSKVCNNNSSKSDKFLWWCEANTSSRIRSAWLYNDTLNFAWNALATNNNGSTWYPYIDVATFNINKNMSYERKYYVTDNTRPWIFGTAIPNAKGDLGILAYYITSKGINSNPNINPYFNLAFGIFNNHTNKWEMMSIADSSSPLPVKDEKGNKDYNFGDFITLRKHPISKDEYSWDGGAYVIVGNNYYNVAPYYITIKK